MRSIVFLLGFAVMLVGCVLPPSLSVDTTDAGANAAPAIVSVRADLVELAEPGPVLFEQGAGTLNLTLYDTDLDDTLYVRIFVDYNNPDPTPPRSTCSSSSKTVKRSATCDLGGLCTSVDVGHDRLMSIVVFDREVLDTGTPLFQAMATTSHGLTSAKSFFLKCRAPSS